MEKPEYYIDKYRKQREELTNSNELWRLRQPSEEAFMAELNKIYSDYESFNWINDFHRKNSIGVSISLLFQKKFTKQEFRIQAESLKKAANEGFKRRAPAIKEYASKLKNPLSKIDFMNINTWISRKQITMDDLPPEVLEEYKDLSGMGSHRTDE